MNKLEAEIVTKERMLISMVLATLFQQEIMLTNAEKREFNLTQRAIATILDIWETNRIKIKSLDVHLLKPGNLIIRVNEAPRVTFISPVYQPETEPAHATA